MNALDTNILIRFVTNDDPIQSAKVRAFFEKTERTPVKLFVPIAVTLEMIWVLENAYGLDRASIQESLGNLLGLSILKFEYGNVLQELVRETSRADLSDRLIALTAKAAGCQTTYSFDKKAILSGLFTELE